MNIMDYLEWRGDMDLTRVPFNEVDNLILAQIIYLDLKGIVPGLEEMKNNLFASSTKISITKATQLYCEKYSPQEIENMPRLKCNCSQLMMAIAHTNRFANCCLSGYVNDIDYENESQFSAMKIDLTNGSVFISFSGTDNTVVGWKENFNMSYLEATPGQKKAVEYVEKTVPFYKNSIILGGHSKGGNLAVYAAMHVKKSIQNRLLGVYNNDGPGFTEKMISEEGYQRILDRVHTYLPQSSIVGMLLDHEEKVEVIKSTNVGIMQHDAFSWEVVGPNFVRVEQLEENSIVLDKTLKRWVFSMEEAQREQFVDALFSILEQAQIENTDELARMNFQQMIELIKTIDGLKPENKEALKKAIKLLWKAMVNK